MNAKLTKAQFYILSFTWGLPLTAVGCVVALCLTSLGYRPQKWGYCYYFEIGENWGGVELGIFFLKDRTFSTHIMNHECGHAVQNCYYGLFMPILISIPSAVRYWLRVCAKHLNANVQLSPYDAVWFEKQATELGVELFNWLAKKHERNINEQNID